jgi:O-antigen/teichoic acid export membrane protein
MSVTKRIAFGAAANGFSRATTIVLALALMPVLFHHLAKEELGVWLLLAQSSALLFILDFGFSVVLTRRIAMAKGKSGSDPDAPLTDETRREIADLVEIGRRLFLGLAILTFLISALSGFFYLRDLHLTTVSLPVVWTSWAVLCLSQAIGVWGLTWNCLLDGVGYVGWDALLSSSMQALILLAQIAALFLGGGLVTLAIIAAAGWFLQRTLLRTFARARRPELFQLRGRFDRAQALEMVSPSLRAWATCLGSIIVLNTDQFFIASFGGMTNLPAYRAAYLVLYNLNVLSVTASGASVVFISQLWQAGQLSEIRRIIVRNMRLGLGLMASGGACILLLGPRLFDVWLGAGNFIGYPILIIFFVLLFLEVQSYGVTLCSRATEDEAFAFWSLGGAGLKLVLAAILGARYGLIGIASSTLLAQLVTNHWYMAYRGLRRLRVGLRSYCTEVLLPVAFLFVLVALAVGATLSARLFATEWQAVIGCSCLAGLVLAGFCWCFVLEPNHRGRIVARWHLARS